METRPATCPCPTCGQRSLLVTEGVDEANRLVRRYECLNRQCRNEPHGAKLCELGSALGLRTLLGIVFLTPM